MLVLLTQKRCPLREGPLPIQSFRYWGEIAALTLSEGGEKLDREHFASSTLITHCVLTHKCVSSVHEWHQCQHLAAHTSKDDLMTILPSLGWSWRYGSWPRMCEDQHQTRIYTAPSPPITTP